MRKNICTLILCLVTASVTAGCGLSTHSTPKDNAPLENVSSAVTEYITDESSTESADTEDETNESASSDSKSDTLNPPDNSDTIIQQAAHSLMLSFSDLGIEYNMTNPKYFWNSLAYLIAGFGAENDSDTYSSGRVTLSSEQVREYASALYSTFDASAPLPDIPADLTSFSYDADTDSYSFPASDFAATTVIPTSCTVNDDGTFTLDLELAITEDTSLILSKWNVTIAPATYNGSKSPIYAYTITDFKSIQ